jgi:Putative polyhydroxyalkanoic acid system protein (PHA_gran_rgn)
MPEPLVVIIPHSLGKDEARRHIADGLGRARTEFARLITLELAEWSGDTLRFRARSLGQRAAGSIAVYDGAVRLEVTLPWLLAKFAAAAQRVIGQKGQVLLEKK